MPEATERRAATYYQVATVFLLLILVGSAITVVWGIITMARPSLTVRHYNWEDVATRDRYLERYKSLPDGRLAASMDTVTTEEATDRWRKSRARILDDQRRSGMQAVLNGGIALFVCLPLFWFHHNVVRREPTRRHEQG